MGAGCSSLQYLPGQFRHGSPLYLWQIIRKEWNGQITRGKLGGTLRGVIENLDYIQELGATCIYMNPIFAAGEYHKYDLLDYHHIDPCFGTDEDFRQLVNDCPVHFGSCVLPTTISAGAVSFTRLAPASRILAISSVGLISRPRCRCQLW